MSDILNKVLTSATLSETRLGRSITFRPSAWMRPALERFAVKLEEAIGKPEGFGLSGALRVIIERELRGSGPDEAYLAGLREGYLRGYHEIQKGLGAGIEATLAGLMPAARAEPPKADE